MSLASDRSMLSKIVLIRRGNDFVMFSYQRVSSTVISHLMVILYTKVI